MNSRRTAKGRLGTSGTQNRPHRRPQAPRSEATPELRYPQKTILGLFHRHRLRSYAFARYVPMHAPTSRQSGFSQWSPTQEIGWSPSQEIRWSPSEEIGWSSTEEILHWPPSWVIGDLVREAGYPRILYRSVRDPAYPCLVVFPELSDRFHAPVYDPEGRLPQDAESWRQS